MLNKRQAFKTAFLLCCAEAGLTMEETHELVKTAKVSLREKRAGWAEIVKAVPGLTTLSNAASGIIGNTTGAVAKSLVPLGMAGAIGIPLAVGGAVGYGAAKLRDINDRDPDEIKMEETRDALRRAATRARMSTASRQRREKRRPSRPML